MEDHMAAFESVHQKQTKESWTDKQLGIFVLKF